MRNFNAEEQYPVVVKIGRTVMEVTHWRKIKDGTVNGCVIVDVSPMRMQINGITPEQLRALAAAMNTVAHEMEESADQHLECDVSEGGEM